SGHRSSVLFDITGRKVFELMPGANDIRHLAPGVYFVVPRHPNLHPPGARGLASGVERQESTIPKVVIVR
ncbi:MAG: T9SS type A sorting domain-containing protein, partial [candidate division WOR-3 bacterium]